MTVLPVVKIRSAGVLLGEQDFVRARRRREMELRQSPYHLAQPFLRERPRQVVRAQPCLDMCDRDAMVEAGQCTEECVLGVALDDDHRPAAAGDDVLELTTAALGELEQARALAPRAMSGSISKHESIWAAISACCPE